MAASLLVAVMAETGRAAPLTSALGPVPPLPSAANGYDAVVEIWYAIYATHPIPVSPRFGAASEIRASLDAEAHEVTIESMVLDAGTVRLAGFPLHGVQLVTVFSPPTTFSFDPATGAFSTLVYPTLVADIPGYGPVAIAPGQMTLNGTFTYQGPPETGPVTMSLQATGEASFDSYYDYYYVTLFVSGPVSIDFSSTTSAYPEGELAGSVDVRSDRGAAVPVADAWVGNFGNEAWTRGDGAFAFGTWPRQIDPTWVYGALKCGSSWLLGSSPRTSLAHGGVTNVGSIPLLGAPGEFVSFR